MINELISLPEELLLEIASRLDRFALLALSQVCRALLYLSLSSSLYWQSDYVPAFLPIAPIGQISAAQFREAALRSWRTRRILMNPYSTSTSDSNLNQHYSRQQTTEIYQPGSNDCPLHQTIGSRFLFAIQQGEIIFWDVYTGRKVLPISQLLQPSQPSQPGGLSSNSSQNKSPFANLERFSLKFGFNEEGISVDSVASICVSTNQIRVAIIWRMSGPSRKYEGFLEQVTITFQTDNAIDKIEPLQTHPALSHDAGGDTNGNSGRNGNDNGDENGDTDEIYAEFQWHAAISVYRVQKLESLISPSYCRMTERYVIINLRFAPDRNKYVRVYDWDNPLRPSYVYYEYHPALISEIICTPSHLVLISRSKWKEGTKHIRGVYIRPIPLRKWFPDSNITSNSKANANSNMGEKSLEEGWVMEGAEGSLRFRGSVGRMFIEDEFKKDYDENTLAMYGENYTSFYAVGGTDTSRLDTSTFSVFMNSPPTTTTAEKKRVLQYYIVFIPSTPIRSLNEETKTKMIGHDGNPGETMDMGQNYIRVLDHGYHAPNLSALSLSRLSGLDITIGEEKEKRSMSADGFHGPYTFIYRPQENHEMRTGDRYLMSKSRSINWLDGFDAHTGIAMVEGERTTTKEIIWYS